MSHNGALNMLTEGYKPVAQMKIELADELGFISNPDYILILPNGDESSAGLPFIITTRRNSFNHYEFLPYNAQGLSLVSPDYQILVYQRATPPPLTTEQ